MKTEKRRWLTTSTQFLLRDSISGRYYARFWQDRQAVWTSLKTNKISVAKARLAEKLKEHKEAGRARSHVANGTETMGQASVVYLASMRSQVDTKESTKHYYEQIVDSIFTCWPSLQEKSPKDISKADSEGWAKTYSARYSPTRYNNAVGVLRKIFDVSIESGAIYKNPASSLGKKTPKSKVPELPSSGEFTRLVDSIARQGAWCSRQCADLVSFLAYTGCRIDEARNVKWSDVNEREGFLWVHGGADSTKNNESRTIPILPALGTLLEDLRSNSRFFKGDREGYVLAVRECQKAIDSACKAVGIQRFTHHDLRHLFITRCINSGVDVPTVAKWAGHKDGGALIMKTYAHLLQEHSKAMAAKVTF